MIAVDLAAVVVLALRLAHSEAGTSGDVVRAVLLVVCALACTLAARGARPVRMGTHSCRGWVDVSMVWVLAAALVLGPALAVATSVAVRLLAWSGDEGPRRSAHRLAHDIATTVLACLVAGMALQFAAGSDDAAVGAGLVGGGPVPLFVAVLAFAVTIALPGRLAAGIRISPVVSLPAAPVIPLPMAPPWWDAIAVEAAMLGSGALAAVAVQINPPLVLMAALPLVLIGRQLPVRPVAHARLLSAPAWCAAAEDGLRRAMHASRPSLLVLIDVTGLGPIAAVHGRPVAAVVRRDIAEAVRCCVRGDDIVGSWGRSGIVVLLAGPAPSADPLPAPSPGPARPMSPSATPPSVPVVVERICAQLAGMELAVDTADGPLSLGRPDADLAAVATPGPGAGLFQLLGSVEVELAERDPALGPAIRPTGHADPA